MIGEAVEMFSKINSLDNLQEIVCERSLTLHEHGQQKGLKYFLREYSNCYELVFSRDKVQLWPIYIQTQSPEKVSHFPVVC